MCGVCVWACTYVWCVGMYVHVCTCMVYTCQCLCLYIKKCLYKVIYFSE